MKKYLVVFFCLKASIYDIQAQEVKMAFEGKNISYYSKSTDGKWTGSDPLPLEKDDNTIIINTEKKTWTILSKTGDPMVYHYEKTRSIIEKDGTETYSMESVDKQGKNLTITYKYAKGAKNRIKLFFLYPRVGFVYNAVLY